MREIIGQRIADNRQQPEEMLSLQCRMERALRAWAKMPDGVPVREAGCRLIEAIAMED